jgi:EAL domain-containing protein (putative c-di-GMP-specific phosphodiesterase class I)
VEIAEDSGLIIDIGSWVIRAASAILSLDKNLNLIVTAEGVERTGQMDWLRSRGCNEAQGVFLSRPLTAAELEQRWLQPATRWAPGSREANG